jgi:hypothetical protein
MVSSRYKIRKIQSNLDGRASERMSYLSVCQESLAGIAMSRCKQDHKEMQWLWHEGRINNKMSLNEEIWLSLPFICI